MFLVIFIFVYNSLFAQNFTIKEDSLGYLLEFRLDTISFKQVQDKYFIPCVKEGTFLFEKEAPELPKFNYSFLTNDFTILDYQVVENVFKDTTVLIAPSLGMIYQNEVISERNEGEVYQKNGFFPEENIKIFESVYINKGKKQSIWLQPLQYEPTKQNLRIYTYLKIRLFIEKKVNQRVQLLDSTSNHLLIIAPDSFRQAFEPFIKWKNQLGINTTFFTVDSLNSVTKIKNTIQSYYNKEQIDYVLLGGGNTIVPTIYSYYGPSDYSYGLLKGNDAYAEIPIGRFAANSEKELHYIIHKSIAYEKALHLSSIKNVLSIASNEDGNNSGDNGESDYQHLALLNHHFSNTGFSTQMIYQGDVQHPSISSQINQGVNYLFYTGHGSEQKWQSVYYSVDSLKNLNNFEVFPIIIDAACLNGNLMKTNLAQEFSVSSKENKPTGSAAMLASSIVQLWAPPMLGQDLFQKYLFTNQDITLGTIILESFYGVIDVYQKGGIETVYTWNLFGDPSLKVFSVPNITTLELSVPNQIDISLDTFRVFGTEGGTVTLVSDGNFITKGIIHNGSVLLNTNNYSITDSLIITISMKNCQPKEKKILPYSSKKAYYFIDNLIVSDSNNQILENNEWIKINPKITNFGHLVGKNIQLSIEIDTSLFYIKKPFFTLDTLLPLRSTEKVFFEIKTKKELVDGKKISFSIKLIDKVGTEKKAIFSIIINAPKLIYDDVFVKNAIQLTQNNFILTSDTMIIYSIVKNIGHSTYYHYKAELDIKNIYIQPYGKQCVLDSLSIGQSDTCQFKVVFTSQIYNGVLLNAIWNFDSLTSKTLHLYYKEKIGFEIANGQKTTFEYPFYNYYKSNHTLMIYEKELFTSTFTIDSIAFYIHYVSNNQLSHQLKKMRVKIGEVDANQIYNFQLQEVYFSELYELPSQNGWFFIDIQDFNFSNQKDILIELSWGLNDFTTNYNDSYQLKGHQTTFNSVFFDYSDNQETSSFSKNSMIRPDIRLSTHNTQNLSNCFFELKDVSQSLEDLFLVIGTQEIDLSKNEMIPLSKGVYQYILIHQNDTLSHGSFIVENSIEKIYLDTHLSFSEPSFLKNIIFEQHQNYIYLKGMNTAIDYQIMNYTGQLFDVEKQQETNADKFYVGTLPKGIYLLKIVSENDFQVFKFIINK